MHIQDTPLLQWSVYVNRGYWRLSPDHVLCSFSENTSVCTLYMLFERYLYTWQKGSLNLPLIIQRSPLTLSEFDYTVVHKLTHWGRVTHIYVSRLTIIGSENGLPPDRRQAIIWTNTGILLIGPLGTNFSEILIEIYTFSFRKMHLKMSSGKWRPFCLGLNVLKLSCWDIHRFTFNTHTLSEWNT